VINDFTAGTATVDKIDLTAFSNIHTFGDAMSRATQVGANTVLDFGGGDTLTLLGVSKASLRVDDFVGLTNTQRHNDFDGDGHSDIMWQRSSIGWVATWELNGGTKIGAHDYGALDPVRWKIAGTGDFNSDGKSDILWYARDNGWVATWELDGAGHKVGAHDYGALAPGRYEIAGVGDFNGDGKSDVLWRASDDGWVATWELDGAGHKVGAHDYGALDPGRYEIAGVGDFNADGKSDILWHAKDDGWVATWELDGAGHKPVRMTMARSIRHAGRSQASVISTPTARATSCGTPRITAGWQPGSSMAPATRSVRMTMARSIRRAGILQASATSTATARRYCMARQG
jgi:uncharacterized protein (DUF2141 family)